MKRETQGECGFGRQAFNPSPLDVPSQKGAAGQKSESLPCFTFWLLSLCRRSLRLQDPSSPLCLPLIYPWVLQPPLPCNLSGLKPAPPPHPTATSCPGLFLCQPHPPQLPVLVLAPPSDLSFQPPSFSAAFGDRAQSDSFPYLDLT